MDFAGTFFVFALETTDLRSALCLLILAGKSRLIKVLVVASESHRFFLLLLTSFLTDSLQNFTSKGLGLSLRGVLPIL